MPIKIHSSSCESSNSGGFGEAVARPCIARTMRANHTTVFHLPTQRLLAYQQLVRLAASSQSSQRLNPPSSGKAWLRFWGRPGLLGK
eukprot:5211037-Amphidinium_carterae.1